MTSRLRFVGQAAALTLLAAATPLLAWVYRGARWQPGDVVLVLHIDDGDAPPIATQLLDGSTAWSQVFRASMGEWNEHMERIALVEGESDAPHAYGNGVNEIFFSSTIHGEEWGEFVLGVTMSDWRHDDPGSYSEGDILLNPNKIVWNSYRGNGRVFSRDLRRVATHELGHLIGLDHPDEASQSVDAIMNSTVSDTDVLQSDDIEGAVAIYSTESEIPEFTLPLEDLTVAVGEPVTLTFEIDGAAPPPDGGDEALSYFWFYPTLDLENHLFTFQDPVLFIGAAQPYDAGTYSLLVSTPVTTLVSEAELTVNPVATSDDTRLANLSTRAYAGAGVQTLQVGFVVTGTGTKRILLRAVGPTLGEPPFNLTGTHPDPRLKLVRQDHGTIATNDDWEVNDAVSAEEIFEVTKAAGGFDLVPGSKDAVLLVDLEPGLYTALVEGESDADGLVIVEAYDVDADESTSQLTNLSTRGYVGTDLNVMIAGLVVEGPGPRTYLIRAIGDTLGDFGVEGFLDDTLLKVYNAAGELIRVKDDWDDPIAHQPMLAEAMDKVGAFPIPHDTAEGGVNNRQESITLLTLAPGAYTLQVSGFDGLEGVALIEIYDYPED